ncbi:MAG TPA: hypothetical protein VHF22_11040, partial [Planctomycetota bacterium]|nr:hypothetical protein [Planctomycetota bacterium]
DELWADLHFAFLESVACYPVDRRPTRVAQNLKLETLRRLCDVQRDTCRQKEIVDALIAVVQRRGVDQFIAPPLDAGEEDAPLAGDDVAEALKQACDRAVEEGLISELDRALITETRLRGHELKTYALEHGLAYDMAKKRRQRAERVVRELMTTASAA